MNLAAISLAALFLAVFVSCVSKLNVGVLAIVMAWIVGVYLGGMKLDAVLSGFPTTLFLTLAGMTLLFTQAQQNELRALLLQVLKEGRPINIRPIIDPKL